MQFAYNLSGIATAHLKKYQIGEAMATAGVPVLVGGAENEGLALAATTTAVDCVGITLDTQGTLVTAQQSDSSDPARLVTVQVNPDAVFSAKMSNGATSDTALALQTVTSDATDGLSVITGAEWSSPTFDEGAVWGYTGNPGVARKITSVSSTTGTVKIAFPNDVLTGENYLRAPYAPTPESQFVELTGTLDQLDASVLVDTDNNNFRVIELLMRDSDDDGRNNSFANLVIYDHVFAAGGSV